jgi:formate/nitrite transporter FocA (FNT family)
MHSKFGANTTNNNCLNIFLKATWVFCQVTRLTYFKQILQLFFSKIITPLFVCLSVYLSPSLPNRTHYMNNYGLDQFLATCCNL